MKLIVIGDSTSGTKLGQLPEKDTEGWAEHLTHIVWQDMCKTENSCRVGWGIRDFFNRKVNLIDSVTNKLEEGDIMLASFGTLERCPLSRNDFGARGSLPGMGKESQVVYDEHYKVEYTVYTFGEYLRMLADKVKARKAKLFLINHIPRNSWENGMHKRTYSREYSIIMRAIAEEKNVGYLDANELLSLFLDSAGEELSKDYYSPKDKAHTTSLGANFFAHIIMSQLKLKYPEDFKFVYGNKP